MTVSLPRLPILLAWASLTLFSAATPAQQTEGDLSPATRQRVEALLRSKASFPPGTTLTFTEGGPSNTPGYLSLTAHFSSEAAGAKGDIPLLLSTDGMHLAQFSTYTLAADPRTTIPSDGKPSQGGPPSAPVVFVNFDDLECPFCAQLHEELFPALTRHYKDQVRVVYQSVPSSGHPWALHAAVDTGCLARQNSDAYWAAVGTIHRHAAEYGGTGRSLILADQELDAETLAEGDRFHLDRASLQSCVTAQDSTLEDAGNKLANSLGVETTPTFFINGAKFSGAVPLSFIFDQIDNALRAQGRTPPPRTAALEK